MIRRHDEDDLQAAAERYLQLRRIRYIHIPGKLQKYIWNKRSAVPPWIAKIASDALKSIPDLLLFDPRGRYLAIELKSDTGRLTEGQKAWLPYGLVVCRDIDDFVLIVNKWSKNDG